MRGKRIKSLNEANSTAAVQVQSVRRTTFGMEMNASYFLGWFFFKVFFRIYFRRRACNLERVPLRGPLILASNHASILDPPAVGVGLRRTVSFLAREDLFQIPVAGRILRSWEAVPVDRDGGSAAGLRAILDRLLAGGTILLFPEGTRSTDGGLQPARSGIGLTVIKSAAPVVPVRVFGTFDAFSRGMRIPRPYKMVVKYGEPMDFRGLRQEAKECPRPRLKEIYRQVADEIMAAIGKLAPCEDKARFP